MVRYTNRQEHKVKICGRLAVRRDPANTNRRRGEACGRSFLLWPGVLGFCASTSLRTRDPERCAPVSATGWRSPPPRPALCTFLATPPRAQPLRRTRLAPPLALQACSQPSPGLQRRLCSCATWPACWGAFASQQQEALAASEHRPSRPQRPRCVLPLWHKERADILALALLSGSPQLGHRARVASPAPLLAHAGYFQPRVHRPPAT